MLLLFGRVNSGVLGVVVRWVISRLVVFVFGLVGMMVGVKYLFMVVFLVLMVFVILVYVVW